MSWVKNNEWLQPDADHSVRWGELLRFLGNLRPYRAPLLGAMALAFAASALSFLVPKIFAWLQEGLLLREWRLVALALGGFLAITLGDVVTGHVIRVVRTRISTRLNRELLLQYYRKILNLGVEDFIEFRQKTNLFQRVIDAMSITPQFTDALIRGGQSAITLLVVGVVVGLLAPAVLLVLSVGAVLVFVYVVLKARELRDLRQRSLSLNYPLVGKMTEIIGGLFTIKTLAASVRVTSDVKELVDGKTEAEYEELKLDSASATVAAALRAVTLMFAMAQAIVMMMNGALGVAEVFALYFLANTFLAPVGDLGGLYQSLSRLSVNVKNFYQVLDLPDEARAAPAPAALPSAEYALAGAGDEIETEGVGGVRRGSRVLVGAGSGYRAGSSGNGGGGGEPPRIVVPAGLSVPGIYGGGEAAEEPRGRIVFRDVCFRYRGSDSDVLHGIDLDVRPGERISLIGKSGVGKTTLTRLLLGFLTPRQGTVEVDGVDISTHADRNAYRRQFGVVSQQDVLFGVSIRENLGFGLPDGVAEERMEEALRMVGLWDDVAKTPEGLDSKYHEDLFSGGQKQRFFIARALLRSPSIVILDEPTSALDFENEKRVMEAVDRLVGGKTTLTIAHRLSTVRGADRVVVLDAGTIRAVGAHDELYESDAYYRALCDYNSFMV